MRDKTRLVLSPVQTLFAIGNIWMIYSGVIKQISQYTLLLAISLIVLTPRLDSFPPTWYDEGYNTHAANMLARYGFYGTYTTDGYEIFDSAISSGPTLIIPAALSFNLFGTGVAQARLVSVIYTILALWGIYRLSMMLYGKAAGLFIALFLLAFPAPDSINFLFVGRQFLGESAALAGVVFGLALWFASWDNGRWPFIILSGLLFGLALLTKPQIAIMLFPTLVLTAALYGFKRNAARSQWGKLLAPAVLMLIILAGWILLQRIVAAGYTPRSGTLDFLNAVKINMFGGLLGRPLSMSALRLIAVMTIAVFITGWRLVRAAPRLATNRAWGEATILLFVMLTVLWFGLLSLGWPRYAHAGFTLSLLLLGKWGWDMFESVRQRLRWPALQAHSYVLATSALTIVVFIINGYVILRQQPGNDAYELGRFIEREIPREAVIESWEWQVDALSAHLNFHHPSQNLLFDATQQLFVEQRPFSLDYDALAANPDYLIHGPFSQWTRLYDPFLLAKEFELVAEFGPYQVYHRIGQ